MRARTTPVTKRLRDDGTNEGRLAAPLPVPALDSLRLRLRLLGLVLTSAIAGGLAVVLVLEPSLLRTDYPLPMAALFVAIGALALWTARGLRRELV